MRNSSRGTLRHLDLFSGCGGFTLAGERTRGKVETTQFVELDPDCQTVLKDHWPHIPITKDIRDYHCQPGDFDLITAGFPCTGTSDAGTRTGLNHPESALFRESLRLIAECQPRFSIIEQPLGVINRGLRAMLGGLRMVGYQSELEVISAAELGAGHRRQRLFIISYPNGLLGYIPSGWGQQVRTMVAATRLDCQWLTVKRNGLCPDSGLSFRLVQGPSIVPPWLIQESCTVPTATPGRIKARKLAGRTVTPPQATIAVNRVLHLNALIP